MEATVRHGLIRARATLTTPSSLVVVLFAGAITGLWTRSAEQMDGPLTSLTDQVAPILFSYLAALWMRGVVAGRVTGAASGFGLWVEAMPNLPVSRRGRCVAEAVVALALLVVIHLLMMGLLTRLLYDMPTGGMLGGICLATPYLLLGDLVRQGRKRRGGWTGVGILAAQLGALHLGLLGIVAGQLATGAALSAVALALAGRPRRESGFAWPSVFGGGQFSRVARPGAQTLGRDQWLRPLLFMALAVTSLFPVGLSLSTAGAGRLLGPTEGGFGRAWSTLPVRPRAVLRGLFLHGVVSGTMLWLVVLGASMASSLLVEGVAQPNRILLSMAGLIPCLAGCLTCAAVGAQARALVALAVAPLTLVMLPVSTLADSPVIAVLGLFGLALVGGGPALLLLCQPARAQ